MNTRSTLGGGTLLGLALLFIGLTILFNHALRGWRLDLTQNRLYTTAAGTDRILASIKEPINLYFFFSAKTAAQLPQLKTYGVRVREFLEELAAASGGRLRLHVIDPQPFSEEEDRASELGVRGTAVGATGTQFYFGLAGTNSTDGHGAIEFFDPNKEQFLEYDVVKLVYQLANPKKPVVAWLSSLPMGPGFDPQTDRKSTRLNSSHGYISYAVFCLKKKNGGGLLLAGWGCLRIVDGSFAQAHLPRELPNRPCAAVICDPDGGHRLMRRLR